MKEQLKQELSDAIYAVYNQEKWFNVESGEQAMDCCMAILEGLEDMVDKQYIKMGIAKNNKCVTIEE